MKSYKEFDRVYIGGSDCAELVVRSVQKVGLLAFGQDDDYLAYECFGDDVQIGDHYIKVFEGETWLMIYDDHGLVYEHSEYGKEHGYEKVDVYRAGEMGCIIHWH